MKLIAVKQGASVRLPTEGGALPLRARRAKLMVAVWTLWARQLMARPPRALEAYRFLREGTRVIDPWARPLQMKSYSEAIGWGGEGGLLSGR